MVDYLIVGAGLYGATCARILSDKGYSCLVIDKRNHIAGNIYTKKNNRGADIHVYGPHIFHTDNIDVWDFVNQFCTMRNFQLNTVANYNNNLYHLPFNLTTMYELFHTYDVKIIQDTIKKEIEAYMNITAGDTKIWTITGAPACLESQAISLVGQTIFHSLIKGYTEKQWGRSCRELPASIITRLPVRYIFNNNYFNDMYQGIPEEGYTVMVANMLRGITVLTETDYLEKPEYWNLQAKKVIYCGAPDELLNNMFGPLEWRSLRFEHVELNNTSIFQGVPIMNFTAYEVPYTRIIEHKWFTPHRFSNCLNDSNETSITYEYPQEWVEGRDKYYAVNNVKNNKLYNKYVDGIKIKYPNIILGGRLGLYKYMDMDDTILAAMKFAEKE